MNCKVCNKELYDEITFENIFSLKYLIHKHCKLILEVKPKESVIPIDGNQIIFTYCFETKMIGYKYEYIELFVLGKCIEIHLNNEDWSIMFFYDETEFNYIDDLAVYLLYKLADKQLLFISMHPY